MCPADLTSLLGVEIPLLQAGMGGIAGPRLASAVSNAGGAGCVGGYKATGGSLVALLHDTCKLTDRPFGVNFIPEVVGPEKLTEQIQIVFGTSPDRVFITLFGLPDPSATPLLTDRNRPVIMQVGSVAEAISAAEFCDALIVQGTEAGGHLLGDLALSDLFDACRSALPTLPIIVSGGIADAATVAVYRCRGAAGVQMGSAFLVAEEAETHPIYAQKVIDATPTDTVISDRFSIGWPGRRHRVLAHSTAVGPRQKSAFIATTLVNSRRYPIPRYSATVPTRSTTGSIDEMAMYCGTSCAHISEMASAGVLVKSFATALTV